MLIDQGFTKHYLLKVVFFFFISQPSKLSAATAVTLRGIPSKLSHDDVIAALEQCGKDSGYKYGVQKVVVMRPKQEVCIDTLAYIGLLFTQKPVQIQSENINP